ncbi:cyclic-phosphate processing receiver domain-containing protein [Tundrisphaera lichenicola]|uniref:cyclic-phosphate processing receiver domain-containing protein n=1 Tax=Tundrisphaera lichenicola TaxID=2029860 RepID=UPI003EB9AC8C
MSKPRRRLFLDDDPERAAAFLRRHPEATWVQTVPECLAKLAEPWDEIHLDHDLGGEVFVQIDREDCGMEVVRWLACEPRKHLRRARFTVHSHNMMAAFEMTIRIRALGFRVEARPFGLEPEKDEARPSNGLRRHWGRVLDLFRRFRGLGSKGAPGVVDPGRPEGLP